MNPDLTRLRNDLQVEATDADAPGTRNSDIRYEIIKGNYDKRFMINEHNGRISVAKPLARKGKSKPTSITGRRTIMNHHQYKTDQGIE